MFAVLPQFVLVMAISPVVASEALFEEPAMVPGGVTSDRPSRNVLRPELPFSLVEGTHRPDAVICKFVEGKPIRLVGNQLVSVEEPATPSVYSELLSPFAIERVFERSVADLEAERAALLPLVPDHLPLPADLNQFYRITTDGPASTERLVNELNLLPLIETAYAELSKDALVMLGNDIAPPTPLFEQGQTFKAPAPNGLGYDEFRSVVGARAPDLTVGHLEASWHFGHEDACQMIAANVVGALPSSSWDSWRNHGDAVAGILTADRNGYGVRGMNDGANFILGSLESGAANMISLCTAVSEAGDVWVSSFAWGVSVYHAPVDWPQAEFDAVSIAATKGIVYCFGAGNTDADLGDTSIYGTRYTPGAPDSGGVIVGASNSSDLNKIGFSNYGARVDCHAWGESIGTIGYGDLFDPSDTQQRYTSGFGGTSGAGPLVAGIAASVSNIVREQNGEQLTAFQIRDKLRTLGTPQGSGGHIGPRADLKKLLASEGLPDGLLIPDDGELGQPVSVLMSGSPSASVVLFLSTGRGRASVGLNRDFLLDPSTLVIVGGISLSASGELTVTGSLPSTPSIAGASFFMQMAAGGGAGFHLSNSAELWIRG